MLLSEVGFVILGGGSVLAGLRFTEFSTGVVEVHLVTASHVALAVVHPAKGDGEDESNDDDGSDEATHVLLDFLASTSGLSASSGGEELERGLGLADGVDELGFGVGFVDPAAGTVVGRLQALSFRGEEAESANADTVGVVPSAEAVLEVVGGTGGLSGEVGAEILDAVRTVPDAGVDGVAELGLRGCAFALGARRFDGHVPLAAAVGLAGRLGLETEAVSRLARAGGVVPHAVVAVFVTFLDGAEAAETRNADATFHLAAVVSNARVFVGAVLGTAGRRLIGLALGADLHNSVEEASVELAARSGVGGGRARSGVADTVDEGALRIGVASGEVGVGALLGEATVRLDGLGTLAGDGGGVGVSAEETSGLEGDGFFGSPETSGLHHGEVDETIRDSGGIDGSEVGETLSGTNEVVTLEELGIRVERVLLPLPDVRALLLLTAATEPGVDAGTSEVVEEDGGGGGVGNADELTGSGSVAAGLATGLGLSVGDLVGGDVFEDGVASAVEDGTNSGRASDDLGVGDGAASVAGGRGGEHDLLESSSGLSSVGVTSEAKGGMGLIPGDSEGSSVGVTEDEAVTNGVASDDGNGVTFDSVFSGRGGGEDLDGSSAGLEVTTGGVVAGGGSGSAVGARLLGADSGGFVGDKDAGRVGAAHQRADGVGAGLGASGVVGVAHDLLLAVAGSNEFAAEVGDTVAVGLAGAEFLVLATRGGEGAIAGAISGGLAGADVGLAGGGDGAEVEEAVRQGLAEEGVECEGATALALTTVDVGVPAAFCGGNAGILGGAGEAGGGDGADGVAVGAVGADEVDGAVSPCGRIGILANVGLRARIRAWAGGPHAKDTEASVGEARERGGFAEERAVLASLLPVLEGASDGLAALAGRVTLPELHLGVVGPDPLAFFFDVVTTDPTEAEELGADGVGVVHVGDNGEAARSSEEAAGFADGASAPPVDGTVGATEVHDLLRVGGKDVARSECPGDGTGSGVGSSGGEGNSGEGDRDLGRAEGRAVGSDDTEFALVAEPGGVE